MLQLTVETITGRSFSLRASPLETVYFVKVKICQLEGIPVNHQILIWKSIELNNDHILSHYNIPNNTTLTLTLTMRGGPINSILTEEPSLQDMVEYLADPGDLPSSSSSSSSLISEKKHGALILYRYGNHTVKIANKDIIHPEALSVEKWRMKWEDLKLRNERQMENRKLKDKMLTLRKEMQRVALSRERKVEPSAHVNVSSSQNNSDSSSGPQVVGHSTRLLSSTQVKHNKYKHQRDRNSNEKHAKMRNITDTIINDPSSLHPQTSFQHIKNLQSHLKIDSVINTNTLLNNKNSLTQTYLNGKPLEFPFKTLEVSNEEKRVQALETSSSEAVADENTAPSPWYGQLDIPWSDKDFHPFLDAYYISASSSSSCTTSCSSENYLEVNKNNIDDSICNTAASPVFRDSTDENNNLLPELTQQQLPVNTSADGCKVESSLGTSNMSLEDDMTSEICDGLKSLNMNGVNKTGIRHKTGESTDEETTRLVRVHSNEEQTKVTCESSTTTTTTTNNILQTSSKTCDNNTTTPTSYLHLKTPTFLDLLRERRQKVELNQNFSVDNIVGMVPPAMKKRVLQPISVEIPRLDERRNRETLNSGRWWGVDTDSMKRNERKSIVNDESFILSKFRNEGINKMNDISRNLLTSQLGLPLIKKPQKSPKPPFLLSTKLQTSDSTSRNLPSSFSSLPPIQPKSLNSSNSNQKHLPSVSPSRLNNRKDVLSPIVKKKPIYFQNTSNCIATNPWHEQVLCYSSDEDDDDMSEDSEEDFYTTVDEEFPTLEIPGSILSSDLKGYQLRVKKFVEDKRLVHSLQLPEVNMMKMFEMFDIIPEEIDWKNRNNTENASANKNTTEPFVGAPKKRKCAVCNKKTSLAASFVCRCGQNLCGSHRYPETHSCSIDYKIEGRKIIEERNPVVNAPKLPKI